MGNIGRKQTEREYEPIEFPSVPEPAPTPEPQRAPARTPEKVPVPA